MAFGGSLFLSTPARAIEINSVVWKQCTSRSGTIPLTCEPVIQVSGDPPFLGTFSWGDGAVSSQIQSNGTTSTFDITHTYTLKGNYSLTVNVTDATGATWRSSYKISAWTAGYVGTAGVTARVEGYGIVPALQRQSQDSETITAFVQNTGSLYLSVLTFQFYAGTDWSHLCTQWTDRAIALPVGDWAYMPWSSITSAQCNGLSPVWVRVTSSAYPALNGTSPKMTVSWSNAIPSAALSVHLTSNNLIVPLGGYASVQYQITNAGFFSMVLRGSPTMNPQGSYALSPVDLGNPTNSLLVNGTQQQTLLGNQALFQGSGRIILQPGQSILVNRTIQALLAGTAQITDLLSGSCPWGSLLIGDSPSACGVNANPGTASITLTATGSQVGATIAMLAANPLANGTEQFVGQILTVGAGTPAMSTRFIFWKTATPANSSFVNGPTMVGAGTVSVTVTGLTPNTNYTVEFQVTALGLNTITSNTLPFVSAGGCTGLGCAGGGGSGSAPSNFVTGFLFFLGAAAGVPPEIFGYLFGAALIAVFIMFMLVLSSRLEVEIHPVIMMSVLWVLIILNTLLFLWPSWIIALMFVFTGIMVWREFSSSGGSSNG